MEEMMATQEELRRSKEELMKDNALLDAILNHLPDYIYFKDEESRFIRISESMLKLFPVKETKDMIGKSDFDFQPQEAAQKYHEEEKNIQNTRKGFIDDIHYEELSNGVEQWVSSTKLPLINKEGQVIGTFGITKDITHLKMLEIQDKEQAAKLEKQDKLQKKKIAEMQKMENELNSKISQMEQETARLKQKIKELSTKG